MSKQHSNLSEETLDLAFNIEDEKKCREHPLNVNPQTYYNFFTSSRVNYLLLPLIITFFIVSELTTMIYFRLLSDY